MTVGCFGTTTCSFAVFNELVDYATCSNMAAITSATCYTSCAESGSFLGSSSMTIEMCLQACTSQGYTYASINLFEFRTILSDEPFGDTIGLMQI